MKSMDVRSVKSFGCHNCRRHKEGSEAGSEVESMDSNVVCEEHDCTTCRHLGLCVFCPEHVHVYPHGEYTNRGRLDT